jgi:hypothetical protein
MGKRRGRRTHSDEGGHRVDVDKGPTVDWPGLTGPSIFTFEGSMEQRWAIVGNLVRARGWRGWSARLLFAMPLLALAVGIVLTVARLF